MFLLRLGATAHGQSVLARPPLFPDGVLLMAGPGLGPADDFARRCGDEVIIRLGDETQRSVLA